MKNYESQIDEILKCASHWIGVEKKTNRIFKCSDLECQNCMFFKDGRCNTSEVYAWLISSSSKPILSVLEKELLKSYKESGAKYIARDSDSIGGKLYVFEYKPQKEGLMWNTSNNVLRLDSTISKHFQFIKWEDKEPYEIKELLK